MAWNETLILTLAFGAMLLGVLLSFIPFMPGSVIVWGIGTISAAATGFQRITLPSVIIMTLIMVLTAARDLWLPFFGVRVAGLSCFTSLGALVGGLVGALVIPVPIVNALVGSVIGAASVEFVAARRANRALRAGSLAMKLFFISYVIELAAVFLIVIVFVISLVTTA